MIYALILTTYMFSSAQKGPAAVTQTSTVGFTTAQACKNAGKVARAGAIGLDDSDKRVVITYQCAPLEI